MQQDQEGDGRSTSNLEKRKHVGPIYDYTQMNKYVITEVLQSTLE
jgi:hypothetical protein